MVILALVQKNKMIEDICVGKRRQDTSPCQAEIASLTMDSAYGRQIYRRTRRFSLWTTFFIAIVFILCWGTTLLFILKRVL
jgi:hypothetical protein